MNGFLVVFLFATCQETSCLWTQFKLQVHPQSWTANGTTVERKKKLAFAIISFPYCRSLTLTLTIQGNLCGCTCHPRKILDSGSPSPPGCCWWRWWPRGAHEAGRALTPISLPIALAQNDSGPPPPPPQETGDEAKKRRRRAEANRRHRGPSVVRLLFIFFDFFLVRKSMRG